MDIPDYKKKYGEPQTLEEILMYCAFIMGQGGLEHRTLHHFNYFVSSLIFGKTEYEYFQKAHPDGNPYPDNDLKTLTYNIQKGSAEDALEIYNKYNPIYRACDDSPLLKYARAFLDYCETEYAYEDD
jgi:hypothetical protein